MNLIINAFVLIVGGFCALAALNTVCGLLFQSFAILGWLMRLIA